MVITSQAHRSAGGRAAQILIVFAERPDVTVEEIALRTGIPPSAVYRHLAMFLDLGLVRRTQIRGRYCSGPVTVQMAENYRREVLGQGAVKRRLRQLAVETDELAAFLVARDNDVLCVEAAEGTRVIRCSFSPGSSKPLTAGASARALLAHLPPARIDRVASANGLSPAQVTRLTVELRQVRARGFAVSVGEVDPGVWGVSAPVLDRGGGLIGVVSTMAPDFRGRPRRDALVTLTHAAAADISRIKDLP